MDWYLLAGQQQHEIRNKVHNITGSSALCFVMTKKSETGVGEGEAKRDGIGVHLTTDSCCCKAETSTAL